MIASEDAGRLAALAHAIASRTGVAVVDIWPLERAIAAGRNPTTGAIVLDEYPSGAALRALADLTHARPELPVVVLGPIDPDINVLIALASGASGYLASGSGPEAVADAVEALMLGETVVPRAVSLPLVQHLRWAGRGIVVSGPHGRTAELTNREWEVLVLLRQARTTAEIARRLVVSTGTVRTYVAAVVRKLGVRDRGSLSGWITFDEQAGSEPERAPPAVIMTLAAGTESRRPANDTNSARVSGRAVCGLRVKRQRRRAPTDQGPLAAGRHWGT